MTELAPQGHEFYPSFDGFYDDFESIGLRGNLKTTSYAYGFGKPSASQQRGIVPFSQGLDVIQQAPPGTGKTITFSYGIVQQLDLDSSVECQALVLHLPRPWQGRLRNVYAGVSGRTYREGKFILEAGVQVVGTPDRIFDMLRRKTLDPKDIKMIVLDQADDMLTGTFTHKKTRDTVMREFRRCSCRILITTDQYARHLEVQQAFVVKPCTIQKRGIVPFCRGLDVIEQAHPGTEKTAACCNGILQRLDYGLNQCQALVLTPRNDLALRTEKLMRALGKYLSVRVLACVGGASVHEDKFFKLVLLSLALPALYLTCFTGRHFAGIILRFSYWTRLMNCLLIRDIFVPLPSVQAGLFSATMSPKCLVITRKFMNKPARIFQKPPDELNLEGFNQFYVDVDQDRWKIEKITELYHSSCHFC
ncbi:hypothetical protein DVH24_000402 [Malus domestica]|uniref:Helicase ATP-binding domain-containing protein n=1 Tax=Malus domestica TaxID=3750 RepID=A0A498J4K9_MALDO|nr:hypothetical protein DVH24_000402 [Malus domestica]